MKVKVKKLSKEAVIPVYSREGDAALDLTCTSVEYNFNKEHIRYGTDIALEIPEGYVGLLFPRSGVIKTGQLLANCVGVIDSNYRGEIKVIYERGWEEFNIGDRIAQLIIMPHPHITLVETDELSNTNRGTGGFGSTGR